jgi:hypothetical protein
MCTTRFSHIEILHSTHRVCLYVTYGSRSKQRSPFLYSLNLLVLVAEINMCSLWG